MKKSIDQMFKLTFIYLIMITMISCTSQNSKKEEGSHVETPNIIIILTDDLGYSDLTCYGAEGFSTPHIDQLATEGAKFTDFYMSASVCTPSRASLMTGAYPKRLGLHKQVLFPFSRTGLNPTEFLIPELLKTKGYTSACIGKWHLGHHEEFMPISQGFDYFYGVPYSNDMDGYVYKNPPFVSPPLPIYRNEEIVAEGINQDSLTIQWTEAALSFIKENKENPFFLYLAHNMPHLPWHASDKFKGSSELGLYGDVLQEIDWSVGQIMDLLKELGMDENTLVIFTSDNGPVIHLENGGSAKPLRGAKTETWEGGFRVPCLMRWKGQIPEGITIHETSSIMDILPTLGEIVGYEEELPKVIDGQSIVSLWSNKKDEVYSAKPLYYYGRNGDLEAMREGEWKYFQTRYSARENKYYEEKQLFNLSSDIGENHNLIEEYPEIAEEFQRKMDAFDAQLNEDARPVGTLSSKSETAQ